MSFWIFFTAIIISSLIFKAVLNYSRLVKIKKLQNLYNSDNKKFIEESEVALSLFEEAGLKDSYVKVTIKSELVIRTALMDIPQYHQQNISVFQNLTLNNERIISVVNKLFLKSKGIFRHRLKETINPLSWILYIINLPSHILKYLDLGESNITMKIIQLSYWIIGMLKILHDLKLINITSFLWEKTLN